MEFKGDKRKKTNKKQEASVKRPVIVIPYVEKVSEAIVRIMKKRNVPVAMEDIEGFIGAPEGQTRQ